MAIRLISYDIPDDKTRSKLADKLLAYGCQRWQYSVFCGSHTNTQWKHCWAAILKILKKYGNGNEKIFVLMIGEQEIRNMLTVGNPPDISEICGEIITVWI